MASEGEATAIEPVQMGWWASIRASAGRLRGQAGRLIRAARQLVRSAGAAIRSRLSPKPRKLRYFEDVLAVELAAINLRRGGDDVAPLPPREGVSPASLPTPRKSPEADPAKPDRAKMMPMPIPCTAIGLALSGGGIRSAATCLGAIQALYDNGALRAIDYLSTVSGGGYIGCSLSAAMSNRGEGFPFAGDVADSPAVSHLRNFSNYLMPRGRNAIWNVADVTLLICRGLLANAVIVLSILLGAALLTYWAYPTPPALAGTSFAPAVVGNLINGIDRVVPLRWLDIFQWTQLPLFRPSLWLLGVIAAVLVLWAVLRSVDRAGLMRFLLRSRARWLDADPRGWLPGLRQMAEFAQARRSSTPRLTSDTRGWMLGASRRLLYLLLLITFLDLQPTMIRWLGWATASPTIGGGGRELGRNLLILIGYVASVALLARRLGKFLETSQRAGTWFTLVRRLLAQLVVLAAALIVPALIWAGYLALSAWLIRARDEPAIAWPLPFLDQWLGAATLAEMFLAAFGILFVLGMMMGGNSYSLHRFYRDRLSKAFLFDTRELTKRGEPIELDGLLLSELRGGRGPYPIINAALNVQGSSEANKRGRNADFFTFTPDFVGSNLTLYAPTSATSAVESAIAMEAEDPSLDVATAMAISGAAISANMGRSTIRAMSATLALLNVRLGYWLRNPRHLGSSTGAASFVGASLRLIFDKFYLLAEMFSQLDEKKAEIYLTDGGHIDNIGLYELLKRGCGLILVVDAEADPTMSFASLLKVEQYARIDLGVRIILPWEEIARASLAAADLIARRECPRRSGPHAAVGQIIYANGAKGLLVYFKASLSGDEKDYLLDYKIRNSAFPHETTGDQFFTEEQFEMHRALGFHLVHGFLHDDNFCYLPKSRDGFRNRDAARAAVIDRLAIRPVPAPGAVTGS